MKVLSTFLVILAVAAARVAPTASLWTLEDLNAAVSDPSTPAALKPYLIDALNNLVESLFEGGDLTAVPVITPAGVLPSPSEGDVAPEVPSPGGAIVVPTPVVQPVQPAPVAPATPAASSAPLVQIIVNVETAQHQEISPKPVGPILEPVIPNPEPVHPSPVTVVEQPAAISPVEVVDIAPTPVVVVPAPAPINPIDVIAITPLELNPIDVIAITPPELNPVDVIAVSPPELNPIDVIAITPPELNPVDVIAVSPPELNPIDVIAINPPVAAGSDAGIPV